MSDVLTEKKVEEIAKALGKFLDLNSAKGSSTEMTDDQKRELFKAVATDPEARGAYAKSRADVILKQLPYQSTVRNIFRVDKMNGTVPSYPVDWDYTLVAVVAPAIGGAARFLYEGDEIFVPPIEINASVEFLKKYALDGRFNIGERATDILKNRIIAREEYVGWKTIKAAISGVLAAQVVYTGGLGAVGNLFTSLSLSGVNLLFTRLDTYQRQMTDLYCTPTRYGDIRRWVTPDIDYYTQREIYKLAGPANGQVYDVSLHKVYDAGGAGSAGNLLTDGEAFGFDTRTFGVISEFMGLTTYEDPTVIRDRKIGILADEELGFAVLDSWAFTELRMTS